MNETCPFYTVSNAFLSAIVFRHSLNSIYQKLIIVRTERKEVKLKERKCVCEKDREKRESVCCTCVDEKRSEFIDGKGSEFINKNNPENAA